VAGRERKPARGDKVEPSAADLADHHGDGTAAQRLLHRPQHVTGFRRRNRHEPLGTKPEIVETGAVGRAVLAEPHLLGDPDHRARLLRMGGKPQGELRGSGKRAFAGSGNLVQGSAGKPAAERMIDRGNPERDRA
jgi:hypothetical protein